MGKMIPNEIEDEVARRKERLLEQASEIWKAGKVGTTTETVVVEI